MPMNTRARKPLDEQQSARVANMKEKFWEKQRKRLNKTPPIGSKADVSPSPLLKLPPELRAQIWSLLVVRPRTKFRYTISQFKPEQRNTFFRNMLSLMLLCRQIRKEATTIFFKHNQIVLYQMYTPQLPEAIRLDEHWFAKSAVPIRRLHLKNHDNLETPKLIASCPDLRYLYIGWVPLTVALNIGVEECKEAWILQYRTNLAWLLSRRNGRLRVEGDGTFYETFEVLGCGDPVDTHEVVELIVELKERCREIAYETQIMSRFDGEEERVDAWIVRVGYKIGGVSTAVLVRRFDECDP